jgi:sulfopyruvate decarboxylase subunit beta
MKRYDIIKEIVNVLTDQLIVCNLGIPSKELYHLRDRAENFYMLGSMGLASSLALGIALSIPERNVWCIDGDGSILMNLGSLSTIASANPKNLTLIVIDNGVYGSTGNQITNTSKKTELDVVARGAGFEYIKVINSAQEIIPELKKSHNSCRFVLIKAQHGNADLKNIPLSPIEIKKRFVLSMQRSAI